ncbi:MAG: lytic transglycosylase domain-containing protein [Elusimicrobia bacterium]|nr:lytic transglycosylase domain-containing protein [Elusimicrobiota bacterium]
MRIRTLIAALALASGSAFARESGAVAEPRAELIAEIEANRIALLPRSEPPSPIALRHQPRLDDIKAAVASASSPSELVQAREDFVAWRGLVLRELHGENQRLIPGAESFAEFSARRVDEAEFVAALRQQLAARRVEAEAGRYSGGVDAPWARRFDGQAPPREDGAVPAGAPRAAGDPARYDKIRALLLSRGVSRRIIDVAVAEGIRRKVDPLLVFSVIHQESNFRTNAYNAGSGCVGLMQLDRATAADMGARGDLYDAETNIRAGVKYLDWIANSFFKMGLDMSDFARIPAEKLAVVLASYNWGVGNVQRSLRRHGAAALEFAAPRETRDYIAEIPRRIGGWFASIW